VPSPQELIVHTQAILQNALIKKQLEDQKERFYKKQQERYFTLYFVMLPINITVRYRQCLLHFFCCILNLFLLNPFSDMI